MAKKHLLIIAFVWPEPNSTAAGNRMLQLMNFFLDKSYQITMASTASESELSMDLESLGIQKGVIQLNHSSFDELVAQLNPDVVLFDRFLTEEQFGWRVAEFAPNAIRILDTEDLHSLRLTRENCLKKRVLFSADEWLNSTITKREIASIYRSDISLIISSYEMYLLKDILRVDESILMHLPFMLDPISEQESKTWKSFEDRSDFICIGNGKHAPNVDAVIWLKEEIWPLIRKQLPEAKLNVYGAYLPQQIQEMHNTETGFLIHGWAENVRVVMEKARINLAPLRFGAGLKGKLLDAMQYGTPSITTAIGAEGMHGEIEWSGNIAESPEDLAKAAVNLYQDKASWLHAQQNGLTICNQLFTKEGHSEFLLQKINTVQGDLKKHRFHNFMGAILQHQTLNSSKYLSKWIEEKNTNK